MKKIEKSKPMEVLKKIQQYLAGELKISKRGVPYLVLGNYSICYFGRYKFLRVFELNPINKKYKDFKTYPELIRYFHNEMKIDYVSNWYL